MADLKISQLTAATTPLAGTEVLPIVQSSTTVKVAVSDLTAGRAISATAATLSTGNLNFSSTAQRITGDMSNATLSNRLAFQTSTVNGNTNFSLLPNGTGVNSGFAAFNNSDPTNASTAVLQMFGASDARVISGITGTGTYLPMTFYTGGSERMQIDTSGNVGIAQTSPNQYLCIGSGTTSTGSPTYTGYLRIGLAAAQTLNTNSGLEFVASTFGSGYGWRLTGNDLGGGSTPLVFESRANNASWSERMRIDSSGNITAAGVYSATVGATNRDVYVDNTGLIGYVSSIRASKTNIAPLSDTNWLLQLQPVTFNYRKKDDTGYTDEADGPQQYGLIAEDVETVAPDLCYYDEVDGQQELRGINYSRLITPLLKLVQDQQDMIADLQIRLAKLEAKK